MPATDFPVGPAGQARSGTLTARRKRQSLRTTATLLAVVLFTQTGLAQQPPGIEISATSVGKYEKVEFRLDVPTQYSNPFDPDEVDLRIELLTPDGDRLRIPAFYTQDYERRAVPQGRRTSDWMYPVGQPRWKARFAPMQVGRYRAVAMLTDSQGTAQSKIVDFTCRPSKRPGFLRTSGKDPRYLETTEGEPFFSIGQNVAFIGVNQFVSVAKADEIFGKLADNGANYVRVWPSCKDWAMAIEARKSAWGRSWHWDPPFAPLPDGDGKRQCVKLAGDGSSVSPSPSHRVALRPGTRYVFSARVRVEGDARVKVETHRLSEEIAGTSDQWQPLKMEFTAGENDLWLGRISFRLAGDGPAWIDRLSLTEADDGPELLWEADPNRAVLGNYNPVDSFMLDEVMAMAEARGLRLQLCLLTRDLYMNRLKDPASEAYDEAIADAKRFFRYAVARWGYSTSVAAWEYFNEMDPGRPTDRFYTEMADYLDQIDVYGHLRTTSTWHASARDCRHPRLDIADVHFYLRPPDRPRLRDEVAAALDRAEFLREHAPAKPAHLGEFGLANDRWMPTEEMKNSSEVVELHNGLWASALSGTSGTALYWWWDRLDRCNGYSHYRPLADFLAGIPWTTANLQPTSATLSTDKVQLVGLQGRDRAYLWLFNPQAAWSEVVIEKRSPKPIDAVEVQLDSLAPGRYDVQWWDTREGKIIRREEITVTSAPVRLAAPKFARDVAVKVVPRDTTQD